MSFGTNKWYNRVNSLARALRGITAREKIDRPTGEVTHNRAECTGKGSRRPKTFVTTIIIGNRVDTERFTPFQTGLMYSGSQWYKQFSSAPLPPPCTLSREARAWIGYFV